MLRQLVKMASPEALRDKLNNVADTMGETAFATHVGRKIVERTKPHEAIPEVYGRYRSLVRDGIAFFLSQVARERLTELVLRQLALDPETDTRERLLELAKRFPTLH